MRLSRRILGEWALLTALLATLCGLAAGQEWFARADRALYDLALALRTRPAPADVLIVAIDEASIARIGRWPWPRAVHATLLERLRAAGAGVVGLDIILDEADRRDPTGDRALADAIRAHGRIVLPVARRLLGPGLAAEGRPAEPFAAAAAGLGHIETPIGADGIVRAVDLWGGLEVPRHPQLALAMLELADPPAAARHPRPAATPGPGWRGAERLHLPFAGPPGSHRSVSYVDVLTGAVPAAQLSGRLVLVGATAAGLGDVYGTPRSEPGRLMPGIEIHANALDALRRGPEIRWLAPAGQAAAAVAATLLLMLAQLRLSPRGALAASAAGGLLAVGGAAALLHGWGLWLAPSAAVLAAALAHPLWSWRRLEAAQRFMDGELHALQGGEPLPAGGLDPLEHRIALVRTAAARQRAMQQAREDTMRFVSHDLRAPLASIITVVDGADRGGTDCGMRLAQAGHYAQQALDLVDDFFRLARAEAADPRGFREVDLPAVAMDAADEAWALAEARGVQILVQDESTGESVVRGDAALLRRALANLIGNGVKYGPAGGTVHLTVRDGADEGLEVAVADQGCGISAENQARLFTPFTRLHHEGGPRPAGVGLGLVIVKTVAASHGGSVAVQSSPGQGATFLLRLPRARQPVTAGAGTQSAP